MKSNEYLENALRIQKVIYREKDNDIATTYSYMGLAFAGMGDDKNMSDDDNAAFKKNKWLDLWA